MDKKTETQELHQLMRQIWDEREDGEGICYCYETGQPLRGTVYRNNSCCYDHVLEKNNRAFPEYSMVKKNIIIIHPDVHTQKHLNIDGTPRIKALKEKLLCLHYENNLKD